MKKEKFTMAEIIADNGESEIVSSKDFGKDSMAKGEFLKFIFNRFGKNSIVDIIFS